ncbi:MAG: winged helix DNA-binding protein, partial [Candidatus Hodarchaeales archaeon]
QAPTETNVVRLAQYLTIPRSTLSKEIKTLTNLHYIESFVSTKTLRDARYKNYKITPKGYKLLFTLKEAFRIALDRLREKEGAING